MFGQNEKNALRKNFADSNDAPILLRTIFRENVVSLYIALTVSEDGYGQGARRLPWHSVDAVRGDSGNGVQRLQP